MSDSVEKAPSVAQPPTAQDTSASSDGDDKLDDQHHRSAHRDSGYGTGVSSSTTPLFRLGSEQGTEETFSFDEDLLQEHEEVAAGRSITEVFPAMETTQGYHHPYDIDTPLSPDPKGQGSSSSQPIDIPINGQHSQRHDHFTPPRGYIKACHRYSTGSLPQYSVLQTQRSMQTQTEGCSAPKAQDIVDNAIKFHEGLLQHAEQKLLQRGQVKRRTRHTSEGGLEEQEEEEEETQGAESLTVAAAAAAAALPHRGRSQSVPVMAKSDLEKLYGQELRRIADEFHCSNVCLEQLYRPPESTTHMRHHSSSYPRSTGHQRGWWQHIIQFISPRRRPTAPATSGSHVVTSVRSSPVITVDPLLESEVE